MLIEFIIMVIFFSVILFFALLGLDLKISLFYWDYYNLYNILLFILMIVWFSQIWKIVVNNSNEKELNELSKYLIDRDTEKSIKYALYIKTIFNFILRILWFLIFWIIIWLFIVDLKSEFIIYKVVYLSIYFAIIISLFLMYHLSIDYIQHKIENKDL